MQKIFNFFFPKPKTDLEIVLNIIEKYGVDNLSPNNFKSDQYIRVGSLLLQFGAKDTICHFKLPGDIVPLFVFNNTNKDVSILREKVIAVSGGSYDV